MEAIAINDIHQTRERIDPYIVETPVWQWRGREVEEAAGLETDVFLKLELFQVTNSFKARGALNNILGLDAETRQRGVSGVSAGNHAIGLSYAAQRLGTTAKVVMPRSVNPARLARVRAYGGEVVLVDDVHEAFAEVERIQREEGRAYVHPFEGRTTVLGTATVGWELCRQVSDLEAVVVPVGGGGLIAGVAAAVKQMQPACRVYGVEPEGADSMHRSFASGQPEAIEAVRTIADSLGAPHAAPYSFEVCRQYVDEMALVGDDEMRAAMRRIFEGIRLAVEPAAAAPLAALAGPLCEKLRGKRVALIVSGTNIDPQTWYNLVA